MGVDVRLEVFLCFLGWFGTDGFLGFENVRVLGEIQTKVGRWMFVFFILSGKKSCRLVGQIFVEPACTW